MLRKMIMRSMNRTVFHWLGCSGAFALTLLAHAHVGSLPSVHDVVAEVTDRIGRELPEATIRELTVTEVVGVLSPLEKEVLSSRHLVFRVDVPVVVTVLGDAGMAGEPFWLEARGFQRTGAVLERGCVYIVPLMESLNLPADCSAVGNPKSSTGRLDVFTRLLTDQGTEFDQVRPGYSGSLYAEISPRTFSILVRRGSRLSQLRIRRGELQPSDAHHLELQQEHRVVDAHLDPGDLKKGVPLTVDV